MFGLKKFDVFFFLDCLVVLANNYISTRRVITNQTAKTILLYLDLDTIYEYQEMQNGYSV